MARCVASKRSWRRSVWMKPCAKQAYKRVIRLRSVSLNWSGRNNMAPAKQRALVISLIAIGVLIVGFFGLRTFHAVRKFYGHRPPPPFGEHIETDVELIRDWLTIPFISKMFHVRPNILFDALEIPPQGNQEKSLKQLNEEYYPQAEGIVLEKIKATVLSNQPRQIQDEMPGVRVTPTSPNIR